MAPTTGSLRAEVRFVLPFSDTFRATPRFESCIASLLTRLPYEQVSKRHRSKNRHATEDSCGGGCDGCCDFCLRDAGAPPMGGNRR